VLEDAGVNLAHVRRVEATTGTALIHVDAARENSITIPAGANAKADQEAVINDMLGTSTTVVMQLEVPLEAVTELELTRAAAPPVRVIDTIGARDAFAGGIRGHDQSRCAVAPGARLGHAVGSLACTAGGARPSMSEATNIAALAATVSSRLQSQPIE